ncbi:TetR/AcrR family transcriptional regulator C-terminal domain-containing protein [Agromyces sp. H66]|uniref:TetR/AcrR family transcriptional regulator C-terminal domain-containing protein n=1 Tax=Agromyces sp. H66 TaxID=2529859 RepID=UPI0010AAD1FD|nr:TetR/AcrR family transcriptional regulator C-terminal domain-containing protein [Agromyces sp. H66]
MTDLPTPPDRTVTRRMPLDRDRVLRAAIRLADRHGLESVSMRKLGQELRVEAMSLYKHVDNKDDIFDGMADLVVSEFEVPADDVDWKSAVRRSAISAHEVLLRHPWAGGLIESRPSAGLARLRYLDATIGVLAAAGFSMPIIRRSIMVLDSYTYGFALQESAWPFEVGTAPQVAASFVRRVPAGDHPNLAAMAESVMDAPDGISPEFAFGLDLILDGLERLRGPVER